MTITVCVLVAEGIVLAADSRQVVVSAAGQMRVDSDNAAKIFRLAPRLAASVCGQGTFYASGHESPRNVGWLLRAAAARLPPDCSVAEAAAALQQQAAEDVERHRDVTGAEQAGVGFYVAGYDPGSEVGVLYRCAATGEVVLERETNDAGAVWNGEGAIVNRLILGYDPRLFECLALPGDEARLRAELNKLQLHLSFQTMPLQDAVDLAVLLVRTTIELQRLADGIVGAPGQFPTCGGMADVAVVTSEAGFQWLQRKPLEVRAG